MLSSTSKRATHGDDKTNTFYSVAVDLRGRIMHEDYSEQKCYINRMSPATAVFVATQRPKKGEQIIAYIEQIGRVEGKVTEIFDDRFEVAINATARKQSKLAAQLTWLANKHELGEIEDRRHERNSSHNMNSEIRLEDGRVYPCRIIDLSVSGAAFEIDVKPEKNTTIWLGSMKGRVVRHFETGISIEFVNIQPIEVIKKFL